MLTTAYSSDDTPLLVLFLTIAYTVVLGVLWATCGS